MATTSETGHSKNVANFDQLISTIVGYGPDYNPTKNSLKPESLQSTSVNAKKAIDAVNETLPVYNNAIAAREMAFGPLSKLATRIMNALKATDTPAPVIDNALTFVRKLQGRRANPKKTEEEKNALLARGVKVKERSASQMGYNNRIDTFDRLIKLLISLPQYTPNETDLQNASLLALLNDLKAKNEAAVAATTPLSNARLSRNNILYSENSGLVDTAMNSKAYIKSLFGATSPQYKLVTILTFKNLKIVH